MKKVWRALLLVSMLTLALTAFASAKYDSIDAVPAGMKIAEKVGAPGQYEVSYAAGLTGSKQCAVFVIKGLWAQSDFASGSTTKPTISADTITYIDQAAVTDSASFTVYPSSVPDSTVVLTGLSDTPIVVGYLAGESASISGKVTSWNDTNDVVIRLYDSKLEDGTIKTDIQASTPTLGIPAANIGTPALNESTATTDNDYTQAYSFSTIEPGNYKLAIYKPGKYVPKIVTITVAGESLDAGEQKLWLYGDVNYDGNVNSRDAAQVLRYDAGARTFESDALLAGDVNSDGTVNSRDATQILRYDIGSSPVFDAIT